MLCGQYFIVQVVLLAVILIHSFEGIILLSPVLASTNVNFVTRKKLSSPISVARCILDVRKFNQFTSGKLI